MVLRLEVKLMLLLLMLLLMVLLLLIPERLALIQRLRMLLRRWLLQLMWLLRLLRLQLLLRLLQLQRLLRLVRLRVVLPVCFTLFFQKRQRLQWCTSTDETQEPVLCCWCCCDSRAAVGALRLSRLRHPRITSARRARVRVPASPRH